MKDSFHRQTMLRSKYPKSVIAVYCFILGMRLISQFEFPQWQLYQFFLGYVDTESTPNNPKEKWEYCLKTPDRLALEHNHVIKQETPKFSNIGDAERTGASDNAPVFGGVRPIEVAVPGLYAT